MEIVNFTTEHQEAFRALNVEWISTYFKMEASDYKALDHPYEYIIDKGGVIKVAIIDKEIAGVCALIKMDDGRFDFELAKMAVAPAHQGKGIGHMIAMDILQEAKQMGATRIYLESNTILKPAISLYHKLGFKEIYDMPSPYERCNIQMELHI